MKKLQDTVGNAQKQEWTRERNQADARSYGIMYCVLMVLIALAGIFNVTPTAGLLLGIGVCAVGLTICLVSFYVHRDKQ